MNEEDEPIIIDEKEIKEQLGHMTVQLLKAQKIELHLRKIIKKLREDK